MARAASSQRRSPRPLRPDPPNSPPPAPPRPAAPRPAQHCVFSRETRELAKTATFTAHSFCNKTAPATCDVLTMTTPFGTAEVARCEPRARALCVAAQGCRSGGGEEGGGGARRGKIAGARQACGVELSIGAERGLWWFAAIQVYERVALGGPQSV